MKFKDLELQKKLEYGSETTKFQKEAKLIISLATAKYSQSMKQCNLSRSPTQPTIYLKLKQNDPIRKDTGWEKVRVRQNFEKICNA